MAQKRNGVATNGKLRDNGDFDNIYESTSPANQHSKAPEKNPYAFKHPYGNITLEEYHDQVDIFNTNYLIMGLASFGFLLLISIIIVVLAEFDQIHRSKNVTSTGHH